MTLIQRFGSALNLNIHFHVQFLDGVYVYRDDQPPRFLQVKAPDKSELEALVQRISKRVGRCLERQGLLGRVDSWNMALMQLRGLVQAEALILGFRDSFIILAAVFIATLIPVWLLRSRKHALAAAST